MKTYSEAWLIATKWEEDDFIGPGALVARALLAHINSLASPQVTDKQIMEGVKALLCATSSEVNSYSPNMLAGYQDEVRRVFMAMSACALSAPPAAPQEAVAGNTVAERLDAMADECKAGSQRQSDLYAAATIWLKHVNRKAAVNNREIAKSLSAMVIEWIGEGQRNGADSWKPGLPDIIEARLDRLTYPASSDAAAPQEQAYTDAVTGERWMLVKAEESNKYCKILTLLGMDEEGDPVAEVQRLVVQEQAPASGGLRERNPLKPAEQQGLFRKFDVRRTDGSHLLGGKHHGCLNYVIDVDHDPAADAAMRPYAYAIRATHPLLASDILAEVDLRIGQKTLARMRAENEAAKGGQSQPQQVTKGGDE